ncbi:hypothetical protein C8J56DRAFT_1025540 [Mycena floridula]|nr:hypothetical protein C8J56DRAFT_1025540 [Mycena floridula]
MNSLGSPSSEDLAEILFSNTATRHEIEKQYQISVKLEQLLRSSDDNQDLVLCEFAASYLPQCIDRIISSPQMPNVDDETLEDLSLSNGYMSMVVAMQHVPYFMLYCRSNNPTAAPGKLLPSIIADRLIKAAPRWNRLIAQVIRAPGPDYEGEAANAVQLLGTFWTAFSRADPEMVISAEQRERLIPLLIGWSTQYRGQFLGVVSSRLRAMFTMRVFNTQMVAPMRKTMKNWNICALPQCNSDNDLRACGTCRTVRYCRPEHQKEHWKGNAACQPHKLFCHRSQY